MPFDWLDPEISDHHHQSLLRSWLHVQVACGLRPETFAEPLRSLGSPQRLLEKHAALLPGFSNSDLSVQLDILKSHRV